MGTGAGIVLPRISPSSALRPSRSSNSSAFRREVSCITTWTRSAKALDSAVRVRNRRSPRMASMLAQGQDGGMERDLGVGGYFIRAADLRVRDRLLRLEHPADDAQLPRPSCGSP